MIQLTRRTYTLRMRQAHTRSSIEQLHASNSLIWMKQHLHSIRRTTHCSHCRAMQQLQSHIHRAWAKRKAVWLQTGDSALSTCGWVVLRHHHLLLSKLTIWLVQQMHLLHMLQVLKIMQFSNAAPSLDQRISASVSKLMCLRTAPSLHRRQPLCSSACRKPHLISSQLAAHVLLLPGSKHPLQTALNAAPRQRCQHVLHLTKLICQGLPVNMPAIQHEHSLPCSVQTRANKALRMLQNRCTSRAHPLWSAVAHKTVQQMATHCSRQAPRRTLHR